MKYQKSAIGRRRVSGISIVEVLVALVVISVGMLGIASLYLTSLKAGRTANLRVQSVNLVADMADRIRANKRGLGAYDTSGTPAAHDCSEVTCKPEEVAENDLLTWQGDIDEALRNLGATGTVTYTEPEAGDVTHHFLVTVTWRESGEDANSSYSVIVELEKKT